MTLLEMADEYAKADALLKNRIKEPGHRVTSKSVSALCRRCEEIPELWRNYAAATTRKDFGEAMSSHSTHRRPSGVHSDLRAWLLENAGDNTETTERVQRNLALAIRQELTERQQLVLRMYYFDQLMEKQIAEKLEVSTSTISRTLTRAEKRLHRVLRYTF